MPRLGAADEDQECGVLYSGALGRHPVSLLMERMIQRLDTGNSLPRSGSSGISNFEILERWKLHLGVLELAGIQGFPVLCEGADLPTLMVLVATTQIRSPGMMLWGLGGDCESLGRQQEEAGRCEGHSRGFRHVSPKLVASFLIFLSFDFS